MRLVFARAGAAASLLVAAAAAALVTTVLLTAFALYAQLLPTGGVRAALAEAPAADRTVLLATASGDDADESDPVARELFEAGLAGVPIHVHAAGYALAQRLPDELPGADQHDDGAYAVVGFFADIDAHADLVDGGWPEPVNMDEPAQVALPVTVADALGIQVADVVPIEHDVLNEPMPVTVVGLWQPHDRADPYWQLAASRLDNGLYGPFVVHPDEFQQRYQRLGRLEWVGAPDVAALAKVGPAAIIDGYRVLQQRAEQLREDGRLEPGAQLTSGLQTRSQALQQATVVNRSGLVLPAALLAVIAGYGLVLLARLLTAHRGSQNALLRARGASRGQLGLVTGAEAALVVAPAALLAAPVGAQVVSWVDRSLAPRPLGLAEDVAAYGWWGPPLGWAVALTAALGCALALTIPAAGRGRTWVAEQQARSRPGRLMRLQRGGLDVALVVLALLAWWQLRRYGGAVTPTAVGSFGVDPLLVAAPVVGVLAATALALRLLPPATRLAARVAGRRNSFAGLLGVWQADRRPHAGPVLLLVLAVATAVLAPAVAATWQQSQRDQAAHLVGADLQLRSTGGGGNATSDSLAATGAEVMAVNRSQVLLPGGQRTTLLAVDSAAAGPVAHIRDDLAAASPEELFGQLREGRPELGGVALPEGAQRLVGTMRFSTIEPWTYEYHHISHDGQILTFHHEVMPPTSGPALVQLRHPGEVITSVTLGTPAVDEPMTIDVLLPATATEVVGFDVSVRVPPEFGVFELTDPPPAEASWYWEDLRVVDSNGVEHPLPLPAQWRMHGADPDRPMSTQINGDATGTVGLDYRRDANLQRSFVLAPSLPERMQLPAVVTPDVLDAAGVALGEMIALGDLVVQPVATVAAMPGTADGSGIAVDLGWLGTHRFAEHRMTPQPNEWWVSASDPSAVVAVAQQRGLAVVDRDHEAQQRLGDPLGSGVLLALWTAAAAAAVLAAFGLAVDARATAVARRREFAVLNTLGTSPATLARALVAEQATLAGMGVVAGLAVGVAVAAGMGTSLVLTPAGEIPLPAPLLALTPVQALPAIGLFLLAVTLGAVVARRARRDVTATALRIGED